MGRGGADESKQNRSLFHFARHKVNRACHVTNPFPCSCAPVRQLDLVLCPWPGKTEVGVKVERKDRTKQGKKMRETWDALCSLKR